MEVSANKSLSVDEAWRRFASGDLDGALALATQTDIDQKPSHHSAALGFFLVQAARLDEAAAVLLPACQRDPHYAPLHWYAGYLFQGLGSKAEAAAAFERALVLDASLDEAAFALGWVLHDLGRVDDATVWADHVLARGRLPQRLQQKAWFLQVQGLHARALPLLREAMHELAPSASEQTQLNLQVAQCLVALGQSDEAMRLMQDRVQSHPDEAPSWHYLGELQMAGGNLKAADASFMKAHERDLTLTDALMRRAEIQHGWQQYAGARWLLGLVLDQLPDHAGAQNLLLQVLLDLNENDEARALLVPRLRKRADRSDLWRLLALLQSRRGRSLAALRTVNRAVAGDPCNVEALRLMGWLAHDCGHRAAAVDAVRRLTILLPRDACVQTQAAFVFLQADQVAHAQIWAERAVACFPELYESWRALSMVRLRQRRLDDARAAIQRALQLRPNHADCMRQLGRVLMATAQYGHAQLVFLRAAESNPADPAPVLELAEAQRRAGHFELALNGIDSLLQRRPRWFPALLARARTMTEGGLGAAAQACAQLLRADRYAPDAVQITLRLASLGDLEAYRLLPLMPAHLLRDQWRAALVDAVYARSQACLERLSSMVGKDLDDDPWAATAVFYAAGFASQTRAADLARLSRNWFRSVKLQAGLAALPPAPVRVGEDSRPRIAYLSSQLHQSLLMRVLCAHSSERAHVFVYSNAPMQGLPSHVHVYPLSPDTLAESFAANGIDIAIDAGGLHPIEGQFDLIQAYARRLAPVQIGWLGCWASAGGLFDVLLADAASIPQAHEAHYDEAVFRLTGGQWCWTPPMGAPDVSSAPLLANAAITFGVNSRSLKLSAACLDVYARILAATPNASIRFIGEIAVDWPLRREVLARMQVLGVSDNRVFFDPFVPYTDYLAWMGRVDLVLDSFPGNGGLSLLDALWMGVPVVTLAGGWAGARQGASLLECLGLTPWIADTEEAFCAKAVALAGDADQLVAHRRTLRARMSGSSLLDGPRLARQIEAIGAQLKVQSAAIAQAPNAKSRTRLRAQFSLDAWLRMPRIIRMPTPPDDRRPTLSVILVLFNQAGLSRRTLQALADQRGVDFETIVVDNASTDRTAELMARVSGVTHVCNPDNRGFLLAARQGAAAARGDYIAFLNSDAILQEGALVAAIRAMQADSSIGVLGGRVVLTDGGLQEAGNTVFSDGSSGGIGRGEDPFGHAARAARSTDYVSGVFLVTPAALWRMLGGFDEAFVPAYYEDTDYCLRVWQAGFRVVYEPAVLLEHLEWGSASADSATALMERNRSVFSSRHSAVSRTQPKPQPLSLDGDRWRSPDDQPRPPRVLFIENAVPHMFKGGGLPRARLMLQALRGWPLTLFPLWDLSDHWHAIRGSLPHSVEVALGYGLAGLEAFLERRRNVYDVLLVSRPDNLKALAPLRKRRPELFNSMRLIYDAEALFALREIAMAGVQGKPIARAHAKSRIAAEIALADAASSVLVVSQRDARYFEAAGHRTHILSHSIGVRRHAPGPSGRSGLLFVGALHPDTPNEDGLLWFVHEVMPLLRDYMAEPPVLSIVGVCQTDRVAMLASADVRILGAQSALEPHYDAARVFIAPVRFAGGVPAKVIEAAAAGLPTVASSLLVRQLAWRDGMDIVGARDARAFASAIRDLLQCDTAWLRQQEAAWEQCALRYDPDLFGQSLRSVLVGSNAP
jgi:predicted O-linked N-acetylglucosamine transferase (SPINDLY family)/GT2 family glycosyltransferase/predicted negative regulator of RcsB-dependent stress response